VTDHTSTRRAMFPPDYGERGTDGDELVAWAAIEDKLRAATSYWITTVAPEARPHARPVDGVWVEGTLVFGGSPATRWVRNLQQNAAISVHLPSGDDVVILEGDVELVEDPEHPLSEPSRVASKAKYPQYYPGDELQPHQPFWMLRPTVAYAWTLEGFPKGATRWTFNP
jgi:hypothetical protein